MADIPAKWATMTRKQLIATATEYRSERDAAKSDMLRAFDERNILLDENAGLRDALGTIDRHDCTCSEMGKTARAALAKHHPQRHGNMTLGSQPLYASTSK